jgi:hypothetical protein
MRPVEIIPEWGIVIPIKGNDEGCEVNYDIL